MHSKLAGHLPLQDMISMALDGAKTKLAASDEKSEEKESGKVSKLLKYEKKEHGHIPSVSEEEKEKKSSIIDFRDPEECEKLASALDEMGAMLKEADSVEIGGEKPQGGMVLPTASPVGGKQNYNMGEAKTGKVPMKTPEKADPSQGSAKTQVENNADNPAGKTPYPAKGVLKVSQVIEQTLIAKQAADAGAAATVKKAPVVFEPVGKPTPVKGGAWTPGQGTSGGKGKEAMDKCGGGDDCKGAECPVHGKKKVSAANPFAKKEEKASGEKKPEEKKSGEKESGQEKKSSGAVAFVLSKIAESAQGGLTQDTPSEAGPKAGGPTSGGNSARSNISSIEAAIKMKKEQGKAPQKKMLSTILTEPALKKSTDPVLQDNLRNASSAGVKIAAAKAYLQKIAEMDDSDPRKQAFKEALKKKKDEKKSGDEKASGEGSEKKSNAMLGGGSGGVAPMPGGSPTPNPMG